MEEMENTSMDITKLVINNQTKTELHKSSPIKTYSKKSPDSATTGSSNNEGGTSRYGRERKHNSMSDFLSTDYRVGHYLKQETVKEAFFKKSTPKKQMKPGNSRSKLTQKRGRGRPRKSLPALGQISDTSLNSTDQNFLNKSLPAIDLATDYQAPVPTSTETMPLPAELKPVTAKSESDTEEVQESDWNCGDLAWGCVPSFPYWPCAIVTDPTSSNFIKHCCIGRSTKPVMQLHVRFFGDNGRRSWVKSVNLMPFTGLDDFQNLVEETCTPELKRTDLKMFKMFTVAPGQRKSWQAAVSEAESLLASPRSERMSYFETLYPSSQGSKSSAAVSTPQTPTPTTPVIDNRKRKLELPKAEKSTIIQEKRFKVDRYSINLDTLALQAAPITPRAIYTIKKHIVTSSNKAAKDPNKPKKLYMKKSEKWLKCNNKVKTGIVAEREAELKKTGSVNRHYVFKVKSINIEGESAQVKSQNVIIEDDFALPDVPDLPDTTSAGLELNDREPTLETSKDVTAMEFETSKTAMTEESNADCNGIVDSSMGSVETLQDVSMIELVPLEAMPLSTPSSTPTRITLATETPVAAVPDSTTHQEITSTPSITPVVKSTPVADSTSTSVKRIRGRPPKHSTTPSGQTPSSAKKAVKTPVVKSNTDSKNSTPTRSTSRPRAKKSLLSSEFTTPPVSKQSVAKSPSVGKSPSVSKVEKAKESDCSLEIRKFGYKGSKMFKQFFELNFEKIVDERPDLSKKDIEKYIEDLWLRKSATARNKFKSRIDASTESDFIVETTQKVKNETPLALPTKSTNGNGSTNARKIPSIFTGIKLDRVCQICLKGENLFRCKGPCTGFYHKECGDNRTIISIKDEILDSTKKVGKKNKKKQSVSNIEQEIKDEICTPIKTEIPDQQMIKEEVSLKPIKTELIEDEECEEKVNAGQSSKMFVDQSGVSSKLNLVNNQCYSASEEQPLDSNKLESNSGSKKVGCLEEKENLLPPDTNELKKIDYNEVNKAISGDNNKEALSGVEKSLPSESKTESVTSSEDSNKSEGSKQDGCFIKKENLLPTDISEVNKVIFGDGLKESLPEVEKTIPTESKAESVTSSEDSNKSEDLKNDGTGKAESTKSSDSDNNNQKKTNKTFSSAKKSKTQDHKNSDSESDNGKGKTGTNTWKCLMCRENVQDSCFLCRCDKQEKKYRCCISSCGLMYHLSCVEIWPQNHTMAGAKGRTVLTCPQHSCHTCISDNPKANMPKYNIDKLVKCLYCPTSYHHSNYCIPAGCEILSNSQMICPRHYEGPSKLHVNAAWCFICSVGGSLICCDLCPNSFHVECLNIPSPEGSYVCEDCETGRYPLYGEIIWVKLGAYRWWPAKILYPSEIPENIKQLSHRRGEFAIKFFGSHDYYWVNRGRVFLYHEGDGETVATKSRVDKIFNQAMIEAREAFTSFCTERDQREAGNKSSFKPPKYIKLNKNVCQNSKLSSLLRPVEGYVANLTPCDCKPEQDNPCGPNSDCINRLLMIECNAQVCPAGDKCCNQNFEKRLYPSLTPFMTDNRGWGLKTNEPIEKGDFIIEYVGEVIDEKEYHRRLVEMQKKKNENYYFLTIDKDTMLDAGPKGNQARFMNHSCNPNCETQKWTVNGVTRVGLFALDNIPKDTELVFNYQLETIGKTKVACKCGASSCTGFIGGAKSINKAETTKVKQESKQEEKSKKGGNSGAKRAKRVNSRGGSKAMSDFCFTCDQGGDLLLCDASNCPNGYHLSCLGLAKEPAGEWICPVHLCSICSQPKVKRCALCINSYCNKHAQGNISKHKTHGLICNNHALSDTSSEQDGDNIKTAIGPNEVCLPIKTEKTESQTASSSPVEGNITRLVNGHT